MDTRNLERINLHSPPWSQLAIKHLRILSIYSIKDPKRLKPFVHTYRILVKITKNGYWKKTHI